MSTIVTPTSSAAIERIGGDHPSFFGIVRGELLKISRMWLTWIMFVLLLGTMTLPYLITATSSDTKLRLEKIPMNFFYNEMQLNLAIFRVFAGFFVIILTSYVIGQEFQYGMIRILLARGLGRIQLLLGKLLAIVLVALALLVFALIIHSILITGEVALIAGNLNAFHVLNAAFWSNTWLYIETVLISLGVSILMAAAVSVVGRSLALGMSLALIWFPADNIGSEFMSIFYRLTKSKFWLDITGYLLGPNLNGMPKVLLPASSLPAQVGTQSVGLEPLVQVDAAHTLWVALVYAVIFAVVALFMIWKRDVKE